MTDTATPRSIVVERELKHSPQKVWRALTEGALIEAWLMANDFRPVAGHRFTLRTQPMPHWNGIVECEVIDVQPQHRLAYRWCTAGAGPDDGLRTVVSWTLTATADGVHLRMEQAGFGPQDEANYRGAQYGWPRFVDGLERVAASLGDEEEEGEEA